MNSPIVLMYHGVISSPKDIPPEREVGAELYDVNFQDFQKQMEFLQGRNAVLTFDDGELNNFKNVFPVLQKLGLKAEFFISVTDVGKAGYMNWEHLRELRDAGMQIGSHGMHHRILTGLKRKVLEQELIDSKDILEHELNINVFSLSVPRGFVDKDVLQIAQEAGYQKVYVSEPCPFSGQCVSRTPVKADWTISRFEMALQKETPWNEKLAGAGKNIFKKTLGHQGYDKIRKFILTKGGFFRKS